jgi:trigger factor
VAEVLEADVTAALKTLAATCTELDDKRDFNALAGHMGFDDAIALRREVRAQLTRRTEDAVARILRMRVLQELLPRFDQRADGAALRLEVASIKRDAEDSGQPLTDEELEALVPLAAKRVVGAMLFGSLAKALSIDPSQDQINTAIERHAAQYQDPEAVREHLEQDSSAAKIVLNELIQDLVVQAVLELAQVTDRPMTQEELMEELQIAALELGGL